MQSRMQMSDEVSYVNIDVNNTKISRTRPDYLGPNPKFENLQNSGPRLGSRPGTEANMPTTNSKN